MHMNSFYKHPSAFYYLFLVIPVSFEKQKYFHPFGWFCMRTPTIARIGQLYNQK